MLRGLTTLIALTLLACGGDEPSPSDLDGGFDAAALDLGGRDVVEPEDAEPPDAAEDAAPEDAAEDIADVGEDAAEDASQGDAADLGPDAEVEAACSDGIDNDGDGLVDLEDPACVDAADDDEADTCGPEHLALNISDRAVVEGTTAGQPAVMTACRDNSAPEAAFLFTLDRPVAALRFSTAGSAFDTLLSVRRDCADEASELACNDDAEAHAPARTSLVEIWDAQPGHYAVIIDGFLEEEGPFTLGVEAALYTGDPCPTPEDPPAVTCPEGHVCSEGACALAACANEIDDDGDGRVDHPADPGCEAPEDPDEADPDPLPQCADAADNDGDGLIDWPADPDCAAASVDSERPPPQCADGRDNDDDGLIDLADPGCEGPEDDDEFQLEACRDGRDNDDDGLRDYPEEPGCQSPYDVAEEDPPVPPECADGIDNDGDGRVDWPEDVESCLFAAQSPEGDPCEGDPIDVSGQPLLRGDLGEAQNRFQSTCAPNSGADAHLIWRAEADRPVAHLILDARATRTGVSMYARRTCGGGEVACGPYFQELDLGAIPAGEALHIFIDALNPRSDGAWQARVTAQVAEGGRCDGGAPWACAVGLECVAEGQTSTCQPAACADFIDNDGDGLTDFPEDPGCEALDDGDETTTFPLPECADGIDNDGDGWTDFGEDPRCVAASDPSEAAECADGVDNDGDGFIDFDQDGDGLPGPLDELGCACAADELESEQPACDDRCDNDHDGLVDLEDPGCAGDVDGLSEAHLAQCADGIDNDEDGRVDYPQDPSCRFSHDPLEEALEAPPECADDLDNDEDGAVDLEDPECASAAGLSEAGGCALEAAPPALIEAATFGAASAHGGSCGGGSAPERIYPIDVPYPAEVRATLRADRFTGLLYAREACGGAELGCAAPSSSLSFEWSGGAFLLFVDALNAHAGAFSLEVVGVYAEGARCGPALSEHARCDEGLSCRPDEAAGHPTCQR